MGAHPRVLLAGGVQALVRRERVSGSLGDDRPTTLAVAVGLGAAVVRLEVHRLLNLVFLAISAVLPVRFVRTGSVAMLRLMDGPPQEHDDAHSCHGTHEPTPALTAPVTPGLSHDHAHAQGATP